MSIGFEDRPGQGYGSSSPPSRRRQALEVLAFLLLVVPVMLLAFVIVRPEVLTFPTVASATLLQNVLLLGLVLFFLWRNGEPLTTVGWTLRGLRQEALLGALLFVPIFFAAGLIEAGLRAAGLDGPEELPSYLVPSGAAELVLAFVLVVVVALAEETIFRGYLIARFAAVFRHPGAAVVLSTVIFAIGHGYQGATGILTVGVLGLLFALVYLWRQSLVAPVVMHFLQNFVGLVLIPIIGTD